MATVPIAGLIDRVAFTDPASGKQELKRTRARQAIIVVGQDTLMRIFVLYAWAGRLSTKDYMAKLLEVQGQWRPRVFGIEDNAMQSLFADLVIVEAKKLKQRIAFSGVTQPSKLDKDFRIRTTLQPVIANGRLLVLKDKHTELLQEIEGFPNSMLKDLVDCLASAVSLLPIRSQASRRRSEVEQLAAYLRASGAPAWYIEERIRQVQEGVA